MPKENKSIEELNALLSQAETEKANLETELAAAKEVLAQKEAENEELQNELVTINNKLADYENNPNKKREKTVLKIGKSDYKVMYPKTEIPGVGIITLQDLKANTIKVEGKSLQEYLVELGSGMLKKVNGNV